LFKGYGAKVGLGNMRVKAENRMVTLYFTPHHPFPEFDGNGHPILYSYQTSFYGVADCRTFGHLSYFSLPAEITDEEAHPSTGARALHGWRNTGRVAERMVKGGFSRYIPSF
jgi:hypothetical protein